MDNNKINTYLLMSLGSGIVIRCLLWLIDAGAFALAITIIAAVAICTNEAVRYVMYGSKRGYWQRRGIHTIARIMAYNLMFNLALWIPEAIRIAILR